MDGREPNTRCSSQIRSYLELMGASFEALFRPSCPQDLHVAKSHKQGVERWSAHTLSESSHGLMLLTALEDFAWGGEFTYILPRTGKLFKASIG